MCLATTKESNQVVLAMPESVEKFSTASFMLATLPIKGPSKAGWARQIIVKQAPASTEPSAEMIRV